MLHSLDYKYQELVKLIIFLCIFTSNHDVFLKNLYIKFCSFLILQHYHVDCEHRSLVIYHLKMTYHHERSAFTQQSFSFFSFIQWQHLFTLMIFKDYKYIFLVSCDFFVIFISNLNMFFLLIFGQLFYFLIKIIIFQKTKDYLPHAFLNR